MIPKRFAAALAALLAAGCTPGGLPPPDAPTIRVTPSPAAAPAARGETSLVVRAVPPGPAGTEIRGAACRAESAFFTAEFLSPARLLMPDYGAAAPVVSVTCRTGDASGSAAAAPEAVWSGGLGGWPAVGISVGTGDASGVGLGVGWAGGGAGGTSGTPVTRYRDLRVPVG